MRIFSSIISVSIFILILLGIGTMWRWTSLSEYADADRVAAFVLSIKDNPFAPLYVLTAYTISGLIVFPITVLIVATALVFDPVTSIAYSLIGCLLNAALIYGVGRLLGRNLVERLEGGVLKRVAKIVSRQGIISLALLRNIPVAPYAVVNAAAGALRINFRNFSLGTLLGMAPGVLLISLLTEQLRTLVEEPNGLTVVVTIALVCLVFLAIWGLKVLVAKRVESEDV